MTVITAGLSCLFGLAEGLPAPCYGYGNLFGEPSNYLEDDLDLAKELKIGQGDTYLASIDYLFEGKNSLMMGYQKKTDDDFRASGWAHGHKETTTMKRFNLLNSETKMLQPGVIFDETNGSMLAYMFVQYSQLFDIAS